MDRKGNGEMFVENRRVRGSVPICEKCIRGIKRIPFSQIAIEIPF